MPIYLSNTPRLADAGEDSGDDKARIAELELQLREAEQFARDVAHKLDMPYAPPVAKGDCVYLAALEALKERAEAAEAGAARLRAVVEACDVVMDTAAMHGLPQQLPPAYRDSWAKAHTSARAALHPEQEGSAKEGEGNERTS